MSARRGASGWSPRLNGDAQDHVPAYVDSLDFIATAAPPTFLVDRLIQRGYLYTLTAKTSHGKTTLMIYLAICVALGQRFLGRPAEKGRVVFLSGENPEDFKYKLLTAYDFWLPHGWEIERGDIIVQPKRFDLKQDLAVALSMARDAEPALMIIDTSTAFRVDDDEDDNHNSKEWGQVLREFTELPSQPAVVVPCHPIKNAKKEELVPRGGGALLNEVDGNLTLWANEERTLGALHWYGKFRGPTFPQLDFAMVQHPYPDRLWLDSAGEPITLPIATPTKEKMPQRVRKLADGPAACLRVLHDLIISEGRFLPNRDPFPSTQGLRGVTLDRWRQECDDRRLCPSDDRKYRNKQFNRWAGILRGGHTAAHDDGSGTETVLVWPTHQEARP